MSTTGISGTNMVSFSRSDINHLANLLNLSKITEVESEQDEPEVKSRTKLGPGQLGLPKGQVKLMKETNFQESEQPKNIWDTSEVPEEEESETCCQGVEPNYTMFFRQHVTAEDVFLQIGNKGPGTASCECLVLKIKLPDTHGMEEIILEVTETTLECKTTVYKLKLELPHKFNPQRSKAEWDDELFELTVTLLIVRELDLLNF